MNCINYMGILSSIGDFLVEGSDSKSTIRNAIADLKCDLIDAKSRGDKAAVVKLQKRIERLKACLATAKKP